MEAEFSQHIFWWETAQISIKILLVGAWLFQAGGRTDRQAGRTKLIVAFRYFANARKDYTGNTLGK
jgi:hypothetical protein